ncbi:hypothetical protein [Halomonas korlensis]|uniref:Uncharacterized protein n=1 Tax=Halomonas korlensis TaxID=463301 RepID=A0A1I7J3H9_9GAMM|nr:hypothetical protein [Halomonas korlensis]SFU79687.1 hypothetical protein SAMN04487955_10931 [Halomonas korlensis]
MSASVHQLPTPSQPPAVQRDRADFGALRAELHQRCADHDLAELWSSLATGERKALLASAKLSPREALTPIEQMAKFNREAIRGAIQRMSQYANRLRRQLEGDKPHPSRELASLARQALAEGDTRAAQHWLALIEKGVA